MSIRLVAALLPLLAVPASAQSEEPFGPLTQEQSAFSNVSKELLGVWSLVTPEITRRIDRSKVSGAAERCLTPVQSSRRLMSALATAGSEQGLPSGTELRGDLVFYLSDGSMRRLDFNRPSLTQAGRWAEKRNPNGEPIFGVEFANRVFAYYFSTFDIAPPRSGFMVEDQALYLKCPPLPERD